MDNASFSADCPALKGQCSEREPECRAQLRREGRQRAPGLACPELRDGPSDRPEAGLRIGEIGAWERMPSAERTQRSRSGFSRRPEGTEVLPFLVSSHRASADQPFAEAETGLRT